MPISTKALGSNEILSLHALQLGFQKTLSTNGVIASGYSMYTGQPKLVPLVPWAEKKRNQMSLAMLSKKALGSLCHIIKVENPNPLLLQVLSMNQF